MSVGRKINMFKKPIFYITLVVLILGILALIYLVPHSFRTIVPINNIDKVLIYDGYVENGPIRELEDIEEFKELVKKAKAWTPPSFIQFKSTTFVYVEVKYKNGRSIFFGPNVYKKNGIWKSFLENDFDFKRLSEMTGTYMAQ